MKRQIVPKPDWRIWLLVALVAMHLPLAHARVLFQRTPDDGIQPRLLNDRNGGIHLLYFKRLGSLMPKAGDLYYRHYLQDEGKWSPRVRVSTDSYAHLDPIGRAGFAIDGEGRIHVVWYQTRPARYFYTRSNPERTAFEPQRSIVTEHLEGVDAGAEIAARGATVVIVWAAGDLMHEAERTVYARVSLDGGTSFGGEQGISDPAYGACACCALSAGFAGDDELALAYRSAVSGTGRHMQVLSANFSQGLVTNTGSYHGELHPLQQWELSGCPVTTNAFAEQDELTTWLVFESQGRIVQLDLGDTAAVSLVAGPSTDTRQKNPAIAFNSRNEKIIVWGEAIGYVAGGALKVQLFDGAGARESSGPVLEPARDISIPDFSFPAAAALRDDSFLVLY